MAANLAKKKWPSPKIKDAAMRLLIREVVKAHGNSGGVTKIYTSGGRLWKESIFLALNKYCLYGRVERREP